MKPLALLFAASLACAQNVVFLEPVGSIDASGAEVKAEMPLMRVADAARYRPWLDNDSARRALSLYRQAHLVLEHRGNVQKQPSDYYVALVPGGNHASIGFRVQSTDGIVDHASHAYILLSPNENSFRNTMLHETGHVAMAMLAGGRQLEGVDLVSIPHSTAALTDRSTAFSEGWAIHLEALHAHLSQDTHVRQLYHRGAILFGDAPYSFDQYFRGASDLANYAQSVARYLEVRENAFAFEPAWKRPDYLRVQLEKARDYAAPRDANSLLESEGFHGSFFFLWLTRGKTIPDEATLSTRSGRVLEAMSAMFEETPPKVDTPWLLEWAIRYMRLFPDEKAELVDVLNDLSHGVFVDESAREMWRRHYLAALRVDRKAMDTPGVAAARKRWRETVMAKPETIFSRVAPVLRCEISTVTVGLEAFGIAGPLVFDINTAPEGILRMVPGLDENGLQTWLNGQPFSSRAEFIKATGGGICKAE